MTRTLLALGLVACLAACATDDHHKSAKQDPPLTPTEQFAITVNSQEDQIMLAPHAEALSPAQTTALQDLVDRWRENGGAQIRIQTPAHGGEDAYRATALIQDALFALGMRPEQVNVTDYDAGVRPHAPIMVGFTRYHAQGPTCGRDWHSFTSSSENQVNSNFGCANTANIAAMIANPADLIAPRASDPADPHRREVVLDKYRQGDITSTSKDTQADGTVSSVGH
jgi:pilus assembly protein CpaD